MPTQQKITSKENPKIKLLKKLSNKKYRDKLGQFMVENLNIIYDGLKSGVKFDSLFATEKFIKKNKNKFEFLLKNSRVKEYYVITDAINKTFSSLETPEGICAIYRQEEQSLDQKATTVYLNKINNPGNLGAILRSGLAFDFKNIILDEHCVDLYNPKTISAAKDAIFKLNIVFDKNLEKLKALKKTMPIVSTRLKNAESVDVLKKYKTFCLVLGNEANGVDQAIQDLSDGFVKIDMSGEIESLNVASAAGIIFYSVYF